MAGVNTPTDAAVDHENGIIQYSSVPDSSDIDGEINSNTPIIGAVYEASGPSV